MRTHEEKMASQRKPYFFSERFEPPCQTSNLEKAMGWCTAMLLFCAKTIVKESRKFELACLKKNTRR